MAGITSLIPLFILFAVVAGFGYVGYQMFLWSNELADRGKKKLEKKNMSFTDDGGLRVKVKGMSSENYVDKTQNVLVNTWNNAALPNYKSRLGWNSTQGKNSPSPSLSPRPGVSRENSEQTRSSARAPSNPSLQPPEQRASVKRSSSPLPGGWD